MFSYSLSGHVDSQVFEVVSRFPESHSVQSESEDPVHLEQDPSQAPQVVESISYSPSGHADSQVFEVVNIFVDSQAVHSVLLDPEHSLHEPLQGWQTLEPSGYFPVVQEPKH